MDNEPDIVERLRGGVDESIGCDCVKCEAAAYIERLRQERDEARREVCEFHHLPGFLIGDYANSRGWDCFKNNP